MRGNKRGRSSGTQGFRGQNRGPGGNMNFQRRSGGRNFHGFGRGFCLGGGNRFGFGACRWAEEDTLITVELLQNEAEILKMKLESINLRIAELENSEQTKGP